MAAPIIATSSVNKTGNASAGITVTFATDGPSGIVAGALLLAEVSVRDDTPSSLSTPSGWEKWGEHVSTNGEWAWFTRLCDGTETGVTFAGGYDATTRGMVVKLHRISGHATSGYVNASSTTPKNTDPVAIAGVITTVDECLIVYGSAVPGSSPQTCTWTGATEIHDLSSDPSEAISESAATKVQATAGATGTATADWNLGGSQIGGHCIAITPFQPAENVTGGSGTNVASADTASITPQANAAIIIDVVSRVASGTPNIPTAAGNSITYVVEKTVTYDGGLRRLTRLRGMHAAPTAGTVTIDCGGQNQALLQWTVSQIFGVNTGGTNASAACRNSVSGSGTGPSLEVTLPAIQNSRNIVLSAHAFADDDAITLGSGFTELSDAASSDATSRLQTQYQMGRDRTAEATQTAVAVAAIATEIRTVGNVATVDTLTSGQAAGQSSFESASVTPAADSLLLLAVYNSKTTNADEPSGITAFGLTWVKLDSDTFGTSSSQRESMYHAMGSNPTPGTVTIAFPASQLACEWSLVEYGNVPLGANGANAVLQFVSNSGTGTSLSVTLAAFGEATKNVAYGAFGVDADNDVTPGTGFTQLHEIRNSTQAETLFTQTKTGEDLGVDASWTTSTPAFGYAAEIVHADPATEVAGRRQGLLLGV